MKVRVRFSIAVLGAVLGAVLSACSVVPAEVDEVRVQAQLAVDEATRAIISGDLNLLKSRYLTSEQDPDAAARLMMDTQREGLRSHYGDQPPQIVDLRDEGDGSFSASVFATKFNAVS